MITYNHDGPSFKTLADLEGADPAELWMNWYSRTLDGGYPGEGMEINGLVIATGARGTGDDLKHEARLHVTTSDQVEAWHAQLVACVKTWLTEDPERDDLEDVFFEVDWPDEAQPAETH